MSKLTDTLRTKAKVFNNYNLLTQFGTTEDFVVIFSRPDSGLAGIGCLHGTRVWSPKAHPKLNRSKTWGNNCVEKEFDGYRDRSMPEALAWIKAELGDPELIPSPFGGKVPKRVIDRAKAWLKDHP